MLRVLLCWAWLPVFFGAGSVVFMQFFLDIALAMGTFFSPPSGFICKSQEPEAWGIASSDSLASESPWDFHFPSEVSY